MEFVDDYERPVLEKYEKITPTPTEKKKKVLEHIFTLNTLHFIIEFTYVLLRLTP